MIRQSGSCVCFLNWFENSLEGKRSAQDPGAERELEEVGQTQPTGSIQINERLGPQVIMEALATVLLQLDLLDPHRLGGHLTPFLPCVGIVCQVPLGSNREPLLGDLVARLLTNQHGLVTSPELNAGVHFTFSFTS